jgi:exosome complex RNA-binding protein Csl4
VINLQNNIEEEKKILKNIINKIPKKKMLNVGDIILGNVIVVKEKIVVVAINNSQDKNKVLSPADSGVIFIKNISQDYVASTDICYKKGDIVKAKITEITPFEYKLSTAQKDLGVIKSHCSKCGEELKLNTNSNQIRCLNCGNIEQKKVAQ